jgi:hypothetical protein
MLATRIVLELAGVSLDGGLLALHRCDNPACCNPGPEHVYAGTKEDNVKDMLRRCKREDNPYYPYHRYYKPVDGERNPQAKLTADQVREIRALKGIETQKSIADRYGVTAGAIGDIHRGTNWKNLH